MADVVSTLRGWSATAASNLPAGTTTIGTNLDDNLREIQAVVRKYTASLASNMASATTVDLSTADGYYVQITGTTTITGLGTESAGIQYLLRFAGALTLTHNATSLILPGATSITTVAGDMALMISEGSGNWRCVSYQRANGGDVLANNFFPGNQTPVAGTSMRIDALLETGSFPLADEAGIWPSGIVHSFAGINKEFTSAMGGAGAPSAALFVFANNNNSPADVCGAIIDAVARTNSDTAFGLNVIARNVAGTTGTKLVGVEIDVEPSAGTTVATTGGGLFINAFSIAMGVPAIQIGGVSSGTFNNGLILGGLASSAAGVSPVASAGMDSLLNTGSGVFTTAAAIFSNTHKIQFSGTASAHGFIYNDSGNSLRVVGGSVATVFRNNADSASLMTVANSGVVTLGSTATINWDAAQTATTVGAAGGASALPATPTGYITIQIAGVTRKVPFYAS